MSLLHSNEINQYFTDCTYKCIPADLKNVNALMVLLGYNFKIDKFQLVLIALLSSEESDIFIELYNFLKNTYSFKPKRITHDFGLSNIKALNAVYSNGDNITIIPCLFHLTQAWWRKASKLGLRKKKKLNTTLCILFNLELLAFMKLEEAKHYYSLIKKEFPDNGNNLNAFYDYFETTWFPYEDNETKFSFDLWSYCKKFSFKGNKKTLIEENKLEDYVFFTNNGCESFNHLINECIKTNNKISFNKFEEMFKNLFLL